MFPCLLFPSSTVFCPCAHVALAFLFYLHFASSTSFNITSFECWTYGIGCEGDATSSNGSIELNTVKEHFRTGRAMYGKPVLLRDSSNGILTDFTTHFSFTIDILNATQNNYSDGFAYYISPVGYEIPPDSSGGYLGLFNLTTHTGMPQIPIVLVEFDSWSNKELGDPAMQHVGINKNSIMSLVYAEEDFRMHSGEIGNAWITCNGTSHNFSVSWKFEGFPMHSLAHEIDLSFLPDLVTIGFSAATGLYPERHVIHSWEFRSTLNSTERENNNVMIKKVTIIFSTCFASVLVIVGISWFIIKKIKEMRNKRDRNAKIVPY